MRKVAVIMILALIIGIGLQVRAAKAKSLPDLIYTIAYNTMLLRQMEQSKQEIKDTLLPVAEGNDTIYLLVATSIEGAFNRPIETTAKDKVRVSAEYGNYWRHKFLVKNRAL